LPIKVNSSKVINRSETRFYKRISEIRDILKSKEFKAINFTAKDIKKFIGRVSQKKYITVNQIYLALLYMVRNGEIEYDLKTDTFSVLKFKDYDIKNKNLELTIELLDEETLISLVTEYDDEIEHQKMLKEIERAKRKAKKKEDGILEEL